MNIKLKNNYSLIYTEKVEQISSLALDMKKLQWNDIENQRTLVLKIDFNQIPYNDYKRVIKRFIKLKNKASKNKINIGIKEDEKKVIGYILNYNEEDAKQKDFIHAINASLLENYNDMYNYIYDVVCDYLDSQFVDKNLCDFRENKCGEKRNTTSTTGCCHQYKNKIIGPIMPKSKFVVCKYLKNKRCTAKCIGCKLFTCDYLKKKGVEFKIRDIFLLDTFFNPIQKYIMKIKVFTPKEKIIKSLLFFR